MRPCYLSAHRVLGAVSQADLEVLRRPLLDAQTHRNDLGFAFTAFGNQLHRAKQPEVDDRLPGVVDGLQGKLIIRFIGKLAAHQAGADLFRALDTRWPEAGLGSRPHCISNRDFTGLAIDLGVAFGFNVGMATGEEVVAQVCSPFW
ncbi:MAG: hypothetical protein ACREXM_16535 [Gammaproteobacteria bacterium]